MPKRTAQAVWTGPRDGSGEVGLGSGGANLRYTFATRFEEDPGSNPEELLAGALASCFTMALARPIDAQQRAARPPRGDGRGRYREGRRGLERDGDQPSTAGRCARAPSGRLRRACPGGEGRLPDLARTASRPDFSLDRELRRRAQAPARGPRQSHRPDPASAMAAKANHWMA